MATQKYYIAFSTQHEGCNLQGIKLNTLQKGKTWKIYIMASYQSFTESVYKEAKVYDFNAVVASVGGSLGLFLGFSCYECGKRLIDRLPIG